MNDPTATTNLEELAARYETEELSGAIERGEFHHGPHPLTGASSVTFTIRLDRHVVAHLREQAAATAEGVTQLVRRWVLERLDDERRQPAPPDPRPALVEAVESMDRSTALLVVDVLEHIGVTGIGQVPRRSSLVTKKAKTRAKAPTKKATPLQDRRVEDDGVMAAAGKMTIRTKKTVTKR
jgi:hypothetical protein